MRRIGTLVVFACLCFLPELAVSTATCQEPVDNKSGKKKVHGRLHKGFGGAQRLTNLPGEGNVTIYAGYESFGGSFGPSVTQPKDFFVQIGCQSDAVIIGTPTNESSGLTENESFIFSDYGVRVQEVLKNNDASPVELGSEVLVTRPGGSLRIGGREVRAEFEGFKAFRLGEQYLMFLKFIPETGAYQAFGERSFEFRGSEYSRLSPAAGWSEKTYKLKGKDDLLTEVRLALRDRCP